MSLFSISTLATVFSSFSLAFFVLWRGKTKLSFQWFWVGFFTGLWALGLWGVISRYDYETALFFQYLLDIGGIMIPLAYLGFVLELVNLKEKKKRLFKLFCLFTFFLLVLSFTPYFKKGLVASFDIFNYWIDPGFLYPIFPTWFSFLMFYSFYLLFSRLKYFTGVVKTQIKYIIVAGVIGFLGGATNFFPQIFGLYPFGNYFVVVYVIIVTYAILRYRLMGIRVIASKIYTYFIIAAFSFVYFHFVYQISVKLLGGVYSAIALILGIFWSVLFAVIFLPLLDYIQKSSDVIFFKGYNPRRIIKDLTIELRGAIKLGEIYEILQKNFKRVLETEELRILIFEKGEKNSDICVSPKYSFNNFDINNSKKLCLLMRENKGLVIRDEIDSKSVRSDLDDIQAKIIAPLIAQNNVFGAIISGEKISCSAYTQEDIEFLEIITTQAAVAIQNALLYEEVSELNKNLEKKVKEQTKDIKEKADHLQKLLQMRSEFLDIASHQLRTPVTVIRGALSMILDGSIKAEDKKMEFIKASFKKSGKLNDVINDILRASEMDTDKFELDLRPTDIHSLLQNVAEDKKMEAEDQDLKFILKLPAKPLPIVMSDERYMEQAITNLINNSLQYTKEGHIKLEAEKEDKFIVIRISDTGIGIPEKDRGKLFKKFGRAKNAVETFTDGSGLGLFIIKKVVDAHKGGSVAIEKTALGRGTTFALRIPIATEADIKKYNQEQAKKAKQAKKKK